MRGCAAVLDTFDDDEFGQRARRLRLDTLIRLRWLARRPSRGHARLLFPTRRAVSGSRLFWLRRRGRGPQLLAEVAISGQPRLEDGFATSILAFDIVQLARAAVPDRRAGQSVFDPLPGPDHDLRGVAAVATDASAARPSRSAARRCWNCGAGHCGPDGSPIEPPPLYVVGLWAAIAVSAVFVSIYGNRVASEARQLASALTATELILARAQHLSQLDGLAAAAAHELGTPLATVALVVHELAAQPKVAAHCADDLRLVEEQVARCRTILRQTVGARRRWPPHSIEEATLGDLIEEIAAPHRLQDVEIEVECQGEGPAPICRRNPAVLYGLTQYRRKRRRLRRASGSQIRATWTPSEVQDRHRRRRARLSRRSACADRRALHFRPAAARRAGRGRGGGRAWSRPVHRQGAAGALGREAGNRQCRLRGRGAEATIVWPLADFRTGSTYRATGVINV